MPGCGDGSVKGCEFDPQNPCRKLPKFPDSTDVQCELTLSETVAKNN